MSKQIYSFNSNDWLLTCDVCNKKITYMSRGGFINASLKKRKTGNIKCKSCSQLGIKPNKEIRKKMSLAKLGDRNPNKRPENKKKISEYQLKRYEIMTNEEREILNDKIRGGRDKLTDEQRKQWRNNQSIAAKLRMKRLGIEYKFVPGYNENTLSYIKNELTKTYNTTFIHAKSDKGEFRIYDNKEKCSYFADAYSKELNLWIELDENHHYKNGKLKKEDIYRQERITELIGCNFQRIKI